MMLGKMNQNKDNGQALVETLFSMMLMIALILGVLQVGLIGTGHMFTILGAHRAARANQHGQDCLDDYDSSWGLGGTNIPVMMSNHPGVAQFGWGGGGTNIEVEDNTDQIRIEVGMDYLLKVLPFFPHPDRMSWGWGHTSLVTGGMDDTILGWGPPIEYVVIAEMPRVWDESKNYAPPNDPY